MCEERLSADGTMEGMRCDKSWYDFLEDGLFNDSRRDGGSWPIVGLFSTSGDAEGIVGKRSGCWLSLLGWIGVF